MTPLDVRLLSGGYILTVIGVGFWLIAAGLVWAVVSGTPVYDRSTGQPESFTLLVVLTVGSASIGAGLTWLGRKILRAYRQGTRSGF